MSRRLLIIVIGAALVVLAVNHFGPGEPPSEAQVEEISTLSETSLEPVTSFNSQKLSVPENLSDKNSILLQIDASSAVVRNLDKDVSLLAFHPERVWPIASITKLATAVVASEKLGGGTQVIIDSESVGIEGISGGFSEGEIFTVNDLIKAMLVVSSNDAAYAVAKTYGYNEFVMEMKSLAENLGMKDTSLVDPSGLSFLNQSTINDLEKLMDYIASEYPELLMVTRTPQTTITEISSGAVRELVNINSFAGDPAFIGGKTGFTNEAGENLVTVVSSDGHKIMIIVLGTRDRFGETEKLLSWYHRNFSF